MKKITIAVLLLIAIWSCSGPSTPELPKAEIQILEFEASGVPWGTSAYYKLRFEVVERGGVAVVIDKITIDNYDAAGTNYAFIELDVVETMGANRILASQARWGSSDFYGLDNHAVSVKMKITINWNDDNKHTGVSSATCNVVNLLPSQVSVSPTARVMSIR